MTEPTGGNNFTVNREIRPQADPTPLTIDQILRENAWVEKLFQSELESVKATLLAMAKALELVQAKADREPSPREVQLQVEALAEVKAEHWKSIDKQFEAVATLANQASISSKVAIDAALSAFDKATLKAEASVDTRINQLLLSTDKRFDTIGNQFSADLGSRDVRIQGVNDRLALIESRVVAIESVRVGAATQRANQQSDKGMNYALIGTIGMVVFGILGVVMGIVLSK